MLVPAALLASAVHAQSSRDACQARHYAAYAEAQREYRRTVERVLLRDEHRGRSNG